LRIGEQHELPQNLEDWRPTRLLSKSDYPQICFY